MKFNEIIYIAMNEKRYIFSFNNINVIILAHRYKNKNKYLIKKNHNYNDHRETCDLCKIANRKFKHSLIKC